MSSIQQQRSNELGRTHLAPSNEHGTIQMMVGNQRPTPTTEPSNPGSSMRPDHGQQRPHGPRPPARSGRQHHEATASTLHPSALHQSELASMLHHASNQWPRSNNP
ncbi:hypothetical protein ACLOJK_024303 [Asimina triloba]